MSYEHLAHKLRGVSGTSNSMADDVFCQLC